MSSTINTNINALAAQRNLATSQFSLNNSIQRLSSGLRINSAKDDAAGMAISGRLTSQIRGLNQAARNANDGISQAQTADGAIKSVGDILQRVRELAVQSANATNSAGDRQALNQEVNQLVSELQRIAESTEFNGAKLLNGSSGHQQFQVGANANQVITASLVNLRANGYGNYRVGSVAASNLSGIGDLTPGSVAGVNGVHLATGDTSAIAAGTITLHAAMGSKDIDYPAGASAAQLAQTVNLADVGVRASAATSFILGAADAAAGAVASGGLSQGTSYTLLLSTDTSGTAGSAPNATPISVSFVAGGSAGGSPISSADQLEAAAEAFNSVSGKTGFNAKVVTTDNGHFGLQLSNDTGADLRIEQATGSITSPGTLVLGALTPGDYFPVDIGNNGSMDFTWHFGGGQSTPEWLAGGQGITAVEVANTVTLSNTTGTAISVNIGLEYVNGFPVYGVIVVPAGTSGPGLAIEALNVVDGDTGTGSMAEMGNLTTANLSGGWAAGSGSWISGNVILDSDASFSVADSQGSSGIAATGFLNSTALAIGQLQSVSTLDVSSVEAANRTLSTVDSALAHSSSERAKLGALQSRFQTAINSLQITSENLSASRSRIMDADFAVETASLARAQILQQAGTAMVAQANQLPQGVLTLLR